MQCGSFDGWRFKVTGSLDVAEGAIIEIPKFVVEVKLKKLQYFVIKRIILKKGTGWNRKTSGIIARLVMDGWCSLNLSMVMPVQGNKRAIQVVLWDDGFSGGAYDDENDEEAHVANAEEAVVKKRWCNAISSLKQQI